MKLSGSSENAFKKPFYGDVAISCCPVASKGAYEILLPIQSDDECFDTVRRHSIGACVSPEL